MNNAWYVFNVVAGFTLAIIGIWAICALTVELLFMKHKRKKAKPEKKLYIHDLREDE